MVGADRHSFCGGLPVDVDHMMFIPTSLISTLGCILSLNKKPRFYLETRRGLPRIHFPFERVDVSTSTMILWFIWASTTSSAMLSSFESGAW